MNVTFNAQTALLITRVLRCGSNGETDLARRRHRHRRCNLVEFNSSPYQRISAGRWRSLISEILGIECAVDSVHIAVNSSRARLRSRCAQSTVYERPGALPEGSFVSLSEGVAFSGPELTFVEMAAMLPLPKLVLLGFELCGGFSRDAFDPRNGSSTYNLAPATSVSRICEFLDQASWLRGAGKAREAVSLLADNAWSPTEAVVATLASLPLHELGYGFNPCVLNKRIFTPEELSRITDARSRVPDILLVGTNVGINYDGAVHLDLESIADAAIGFAHDSESPYMRRMLEETMQRVRAKAIDDLRRNRELAASGYVVFPVTKEDLYDYGALDRVMLQAISAIERFGDQDLSMQQKFVSNVSFAKSRQALIWSLIPGDATARIARMRRDEARANNPVVYELEIGF